MPSLMRRLYLLTLIVALAALSCAARSESSATPVAVAQENKAEQEQPAEKKEEDKKKDTRRRRGQDDVDAAVFSEAAANSVLRDMRDGIEGRSQRLFLSAFDPDKMDGYLNFEDQIQSFFDRHESLRLHYRITQTTSEGGRGVALVSVDMELIPRGATAPQRRSTQMRFELERGRRGWKVVDFRPRDFFN
jgi:hypothetical protein